MTERFVTVALISLALIASAGLLSGMLAHEPPGEAPAPSWTTAATVTRVIDGDTVEVEIRRTLRVRMLDCWAPESRVDPRVTAADQQRQKARGLASKQHLKQLAEGRNVIVQVPLSADGDLTASITLGRVLGHVWLSDQPRESLSAVQVRTGHATATKPEELR